MDYVQIRGGRGGPCSNFLSPFHKCIFGQLKEYISSKMPIIWTLNCFFMLYTWPTKQVFCLYLRRILDNKSFWMSLKLTFLALKNSGTSCPNWWERGGRGHRASGGGQFRQFLFFSIELFLLIYHKFGCTWLHFIAFYIKITQKHSNITVFIHLVHWNHRNLSFSEIGLFSIVFKTQQFLWCYFLFSLFLLGDDAKKRDLPIEISQFLRLLLRIFGKK